MDRIAILESFVARAPDDPFPRYGLAMELVNLGRPQEALPIFAELLERAPGYLPAYLMYGNALSGAGKRDEALAIYRRGIELARTQHNGKTEAELEAALAAAGG
jgi:tetratricopeptide (TPR) repeat protein